MNKFLTVSLLALLVTTQSKAVSITASATTPVAPVFFGPYIGPFDTRTDPTFATFAFGPAYTSLPSFDTASFTLVASGLQTMPTDTWVNNLTLTLGGIDTGILLNGYHDFPTIDTMTFTGTISSGASLSILSYMAANGGNLVAGIHDSSAAASNSFFFTGASASLTLTKTADVAVPFDPASSLGLSILTFMAGFRAYRRYGVAGIKKFFA